MGASARNPRRYYVTVHVGVCIYSAERAAMQSPEQDFTDGLASWIVAGCERDIRELDWKSVIHSLLTSSLSVEGFVEHFGPGIALYLDRHRLGLVDAAAFSRSVYFDMREAVLKGLPEVASEFPELLLDAVSARVAAEIEGAFWRSVASDARS